MPFNTKPQLRDKYGQLIPQYWDEAADEYKPITGALPVAVGDINIPNDVVDRANRELGKVTLNGSKAVGEGSLQASFEDDGSGKGLLRQFVASLLDAAQDSVAIAGARADSLQRRRERTIDVSLAKTLAQGEVETVIDTTSSIVIDLAEIAVGSDAALDLNVEFYVRNPDSSYTPYRILRWDGTKPVVTALLLGYVPLGSDLLSNSFGFDSYFVRSIKTDTAPKYQKIWLRENHRIEMPLGGRLLLNNLRAGSIDIAYHIRYGVYPV